MSLPNRLYYPLDKVAKELGCDISDIVHYAANGYIKVCTKIYVGPAFGDEVLESWSADLLVNEKYLNKIVAEYYLPYINEFDDIKSGSPCASGEVDFDYVNSYVMLRGKINFWVGEESKKVEDYETDIYGVRGLLQIASAHIYRNEELLLNGGAFDVNYFNLPIDNTHQLAEGHFKRFVSEFAHSGWVSDYIDKDTEELRRELIGNKVNSFREPVVVSLKDLYVTADEVLKIKSGKVREASLDSLKGCESAKTMAKKGEIIHSLLCLIPDFDGVDLDSMPITKIKDIVESVAATKRIELPKTHIQTWAQYLGRERKKR